MFRLVIAFSVCLLTLIGIAACQFGRTKGPQIIVIMVENLGVQQINCGATDNANSGFQLMCQESIRFTHAFTTSPLAAPAMASILTGHYPLEHGLRHHGLSFLSSQKETLAEKAQEYGLATAFFSGGAPALRKYNIQQGFELFDDSFNLSQSNVYRKFEQSLELFKDWSDDIGRDPA